MSDFIIKQIQVKRANSATWISTNPILLDGEIGFERDANKIKIGNGVSNWQQLEYISGTGLGGGLASIIADSSPQLGGDLDLNGNKIIGLTIDVDVQKYSPILSNTTSAFTTAKDAQLVLNNAKRTYPILDQNKVALISGVNSGDQDLSGIGINAAAIALNTAATVINTAKKGVTAEQEAKLASISGVNTGDQDITLVGNNLTLSGGSTVNLPVTSSGTGGNIDSVNGQVGTVILTANDIDDTNSTKKFITASDKTKLDNVSGVNSGDQDVSGITTNSNDIAVNSALIATNINNISNKQNTLDATNLKTINGNSLIGSGNILISSGTGGGDDVFQGQVLSAGYEILASDFTSGKAQLYYNGTENIEILLNTDVANNGEKLIIWQYGTGKVQVKINENVPGISFQTIDNTNPVTLTRTFSPVFGYRAIGNYEVYTPVGPAVFPAGNAASIGASEDNDVPLNMIGDTSSVLVTSSNENVRDSNFALKFVHQGPDNTSYTIKIPVTVEVGATYELRAVGKVTVGARNWFVGFSNNVNEGWTIPAGKLNAVFGAGNQAGTEGTWQNTETDGRVATGTATIANTFLSISPSSVVDTNSTLFLDNIELVKIS